MAMFGELNLRAKDVEVDVVADDAVGVVDEGEKGFENGLDRYANLTSNLIRDAVNFCGFLWDKKVLWLDDDVQTRKLPLAVHE